MPYLPDSVLIYGGYWTCAFCDIIDGTEVTDDEHHHPAKGLCEATVSWVPLASVSHCPECDEPLPIRRDYASNEVYIAEHCRACWARLGADLHRSTIH